MMVEINIYTNRQNGIGGGRGHFLKQLPYGYSGTQNIQFYQIIIFLIRSSITKSNRGYLRGPITAFRKNIKENA